LIARWRERIVTLQVHTKKALASAYKSRRRERAFAHAAIDLTAGEAGELAELIDTPRQFVV
jgi:hypothetical protein